MSVRALLARGFTQSTLPYGAWIETPINVVDDALSQENSWARVTFNPLVGSKRKWGQYQVASNTNSEALQVWLIGAGGVADYEIKATTISGTLSFGTVGVWQSLSTDRVYEVDRVIPGSKTWVGTIAIRQVAAPYTVLATSSVTLTASVAP